MNRQHKKGGWEIAHPVILKFSSYELRGQEPENRGPCPWIDSLRAEVYLGYSLVILPRAREIQTWEDDIFE